MALPLYFTERGDPDRLRAEARRLASTGETMRQLATMLQEISTKGVWDSDAGTAFAGEVGACPETMHQLATRLEDTAGVLRPYADVLAESQRVMASERAWYEKHVTISDSLRARLEGMSPGDPEYMRVDLEWRRAADEREVARRRYQREGEQAALDEETVARRLDDIAQTSTDPWGYDLFEGLSALGRSAAVNNVVVDSVPALRWVSLLKFADPIGQLGLRAFYGQGSYVGVGKATMQTTLNVVKVPVGAGAKLDDAARRSSRASETAAAKARHAGRAGASGRGPTALRHKAGTKVRQTTAGTTVRAKHAAQDGFEHATGIRLINNMTSDWAAIAGAGHMTKGVHALKYSVAAADKVDGTVRTARTTADTIRPRTGKQGASRGSS